MELVEVSFVSTFRALGVSLQRIRHAREYAAQELGAEFPFTEYRWLTEGHHLMIRLQELEEQAEPGRLVVADVHGQVAWQQLVGDRFAQFDYESGLALVWHPAGRASSVVIDPRVAFGAPTVGGVPTWTIRGRWTAGEAIEDIQEDLGIDLNLVCEGLQFEGVIVGK